MKLKRSAVVVVSPRAEIRGAFPDLLNILCLLGFKCIVLGGQKSQLRTDLPSDVIYQQIVLSKIISKWPANRQRFLAFLIEQLLTIFSLIRLGKKADMILFSHTLMPFPLIQTRLIREKSLIYIGGISHLAVLQQQSIEKAFILSLEDIYYRLANCVLVVCNGLATEYPLNKYREKIFEAPNRLLDDGFFERFNFSLPSRKENIVGFVGRFSQEKGIMEFVDSIPLVHNKRKDISFIIIGDGDLKDDIREKLKTFNMDTAVTLLPWVNNIEDYLKRIKLLVVPSRTEGLPSVIIEALSSGTLVLAAPVGCITGLLEDERNGFLLEKSLPQDISSRILEILNRSSSDLDKVSNRGIYSLKQKNGKTMSLNKWKQAIETVICA